MLENEAEALVADVVEITSGERGSIGAAQGEGAGSGAVEQGKEVHEGGFAGARFADDGDGFAWVDLEVETLERREGGRTATVDFGKIGDLEDGLHYLIIAN